MKLVHNNEHMDPSTYVYSDHQYDYCIINGESITRYHGSIGGQYESIPLHKIASIQWLLNQPRTKWIRTLLTIDRRTTKLYKYQDLLISRIVDELKLDLFGIHKG